MIDQFVKDMSSKKLIWFGEMHGIKENYDVYRFLINKYHFTQVALEYPTGLETFSDDKFLIYSHVKDGRFSKESLSFFRWLKKNRIKTICFDNRMSTSGSQQRGENNMADYLLKKINSTATFVLSGNFHSQVSQKLVLGKKVTPMAGLVKKTYSDLVTVEISYSGGGFYNFGVREIDSNYLCYDSQNLPFGSVTLNTNQLKDDIYNFHAGKATPVTIIED